MTLSLRWWMGARRSGAIFTLLEFGVLHIIERVARVYGCRFRVERVCGGLAVYHHRHETNGWPKSGQARRKTIDKDQLG